MKSNLVIALLLENAESKCLYSHCDLVCSLNNSVCSCPLRWEQTVDPSFVVRVPCPLTASVRLDWFFLEMSTGKKNTTSTREINHKHAAPNDTFKIHCSCISRPLCIQASHEEQILTLGILGVEHKPVLNFTVWWSKPMQCIVMVMNQPVNLGKHAEFQVLHIKFLN